MAPPVTASDDPARVRRLLSDWETSPPADGELPELQADVPALIDHTGSQPAAYFEAQLREWTGDADAMAAALVRSGLVIGVNWDRYHFRGHRLTQAAICQGQAKAAARGVPPILFFAAPKSASDFLAVSLSRVLGAPIARTSRGLFPIARIVEPWLGTALRGGMITHEHPPAQAANLEVLVRSGSPRIWVHLRNPLDIAVSLYHHVQRYGHQDLMRRKLMAFGVVPPGSEAAFHDLDGFVRLFFPICERWVADWLSVVDRGEVNAILTSYEAFRSDPAAFLIAILPRLGLLAGKRARDLIPSIAQGRTSAKGGPGHHFRQGEADSWRRETSRETQAALAASIRTAWIYPRMGWSRPAP